MGGQGDARRKEAWILRGARDLAAELGTELAEYCRDVDAHLLEHAAAHDGHAAAAAILAVRPALAPPSLALELSGRQLAMCPGEIILELLEGGANAVAQALEPGAGLFLALGKRRLVGQRRGALRAGGGALGEGGHASP